MSLKDAHGGALVRAQTCSKRFNKKVNLRACSILHLRAHPRFHFREQLKINKNVKKKDAFYASVDEPLDTAIKGCT